MTISVVMINYNNAEFLRQAIDSVVEQTVRPDEMVISDDGSTDGSLEIIRDYCARFPFMRLERTPRNLGAAGNRDHAIRQAESRFVMNLDSDDWLQPEVVEKTLAMLNMHPDRIVISDFHVVDRSGRLLQTVGTGKFVNSRRPLWELAARTSTMPGNQFAMAKELYLRLGGLDQEFALYEDWEFFLRAAQHGVRWAHTGVIGFSYRKSGIGLSAASRRKHLHFHLQVMRKALSHPAGRFQLLSGYSQLFVRKGFKYLTGKASPVGFN